MMVRETSVVHSYLWWCQVTSRRNDIQYTAADERQIGFSDSETINVEQIYQLSRVRLICAVKTNIQLILENEIRQAYYNRPSVAIQLLLSTTPNLVS